MGVGGICVGVSEGIAVAVGVSVSVAVRVQVAVGGTGVEVGSRTTPTAVMRAFGPADGRAVPG